MCSGVRDISSTLSIVCPAHNDAAQEVVHSGSNNVWYIELVPDKC